MAGRIVTALTTLVMAASIASAVPAAPAPGLVAAYAFSAGAGAAAADSSETGNNGTLLNAQWISTGRFGKGLMFDGTARVTVEWRAVVGLDHWDDAGGVGVPYRRSPRSVARRHLQGKRQLLSDGVDARRSAGNWWHVHQAAHRTVGAPSQRLVPSRRDMHEGTTLRLYVNGGASGEPCADWADSHLPCSLSIGGDPLYGQGFVGKIDEVRVYNKALTMAGEIQNDMAQPLDPGSGPDAAHHLDEFAGSRLDCIPRREAHGKRIRRISGFRLFSSSWTGRISVRTTRLPTRSTGTRLLQATVLTPYRGRAGRRRQ